LKILETIQLAPFTTLKIGGPARFFVKAQTEDEVVEAFQHAKSNGLALFVLGGGSNILVSDTGFDGLVLQIALKGKSTIEGPNGKVEITAQAGEDWDEFVRYAVENDLAGIECLSGIPGLVGGTPVQNVGAYGQEVSETITNVRCFDRTTKTIVELSNVDCGFSYRKSIFNSTERDRYIVLAVTYLLAAGGKPKIVYKDLKEYFGDRDASLKETRGAVLAIRRAKSMVIDESDPNSRSAGSFFKNPIVDISKLDEIKASGFETVPRFPAGDGLVKLPAAWLIERSGFNKGFRLGNAGISENHSLALINFGGATAAEIVDLKNAIQAGVFEKFGIQIFPEPIFVGFDP